MFCVKCGAELPETAEFCPLCGTKVMYRPKLHISSPEVPKNDYQSSKKTTSEVSGFTSQNATPYFSSSVPPNSTPEYSGSAPQIFMSKFSDSASKNSIPEFSDSTQKNKISNFNDPSPPKSSSTSWLHIFAAVMAVLALFIGIGTFFLIRDKDTTTGSSGSTQNADVNTQVSSTSTVQTTETQKSSNSVTKKSNNTKEFYLVEVWEYEYGTTTYAKSITQYEYDDKWNLIAEIRDGLPKYKYEYDATGKCIAEYEYNKNGVFQTGTKYEYDETDTYIIRDNFVNSQNELQGYAEYEYDDQNRVTRYSDYLLDGRLSKYVEYNYNSDGSYSMIEHLNLLFSEKRISHLYNAAGNEYWCETTYAHTDQRELEEKTWSDDGKVLSIIESWYNGEDMYLEETRTNEFNDQGYFSHAIITVRELNIERTEYNESFYNIYQEYDKYGNKLHYWNEKTGNEYYYVYENKAGVRFGDDFEHRGVTE